MKSNWIPIILVVVIKYIIWGFKYLTDKKELKIKGDIMKERIN